MNPAPNRADHNIRLMVPDQPLADHAGPVGVTGWQLESISSAGLGRAFRHHHVFQRVADFPPGAREAELPWTMVALMQHAAAGRGRVQVDLGVRPFLWVRQFHSQLLTNWPPNYAVQGPQEDLFRLEIPPPRPDIQPHVVQLARINYKSGDYAPLPTPLLGCVFNLCRSLGNFFKNNGPDQPLYAAARDALRHYLLARWQASPLARELVWNALEGRFEYQSHLGDHRVELVEHDPVSGWEVPARVVIRLGNGIQDEEVDVSFPPDAPPRLLLEAVRRVCARSGEGGVSWFRADGCPLGTPIEAEDA
jgi:hypothetical protein